MAFRKNHRHPSRRRCLGPGGAILGCAYRCLRDGDCCVGGGCFGGGSRILLVSLLFALRFALLVFDTFPLATIPVSLNECVRRFLDDLLGLFHTVKKALVGLFLALCKFLGSLPSSLLLRLMLTAALFQLLITKIVGLPLLFLALLKPIGGLSPG